MSAAKRMLPGKPREDCSADAIHNSFGEQEKLGRSGLKIDYVPAIDGGHTGLILIYRTLIERDWFRCPNRIFRTDIPDRGIEAVDIS